MFATQVLSLCAILVSSATFANSQIVYTATPVENALTPRETVPTSIETSPVPLWTTPVFSNAALTPEPASPTAAAGTTTPAQGQSTTNPVVATVTPAPEAAAPTPVAATAPVFADEPISDMLPDNTLLEQPGAMEMVEELREEIVEQGSCNVNVCFALDGSRRISAENYRRVQDFVQLVTAIVGVDTSAAFAAVQYFGRNVPISPLTNDVDRFLKSVDNSVPQGGQNSFLANGLRFCIRQLGPRTEDANKIVILGDGRFRQAGNPLRLARDNRRPRGNMDICAVAVGFSNTRRLERITGNSNRVFAIDGYFELLDVIEELVAEICGLDV